MATFTALAKIYSTKYFCNTKVAGLGEIFVQQNFVVYSIMLKTNTTPDSPTCNHRVMDHVNELHQREYILGQPSKPLEDIQSKQLQLENSITVSTIQGEELHTF